MVKHVKRPIAPVTDGEKEGNIDKVIRKVAKRVTIEKDALQIE